MLRDTYLPKIIENRINPEIGIDSFALDNFQMKDFQDVAGRLHGEGLSVTLHAPYMEMVPGGIDPKMRNATLSRLDQAFDLVPIFKPLSVVCHPGYDHRCYYDDQEQWLKNSIDTWAIFAHKAREMDTIVTIENVFEEIPGVIKPIFQALHSDNFKFCFDVGHSHVFGKEPIDVWMEQLGRYLGQIHLHDNRGRMDDHMAVGAGEVEFERLFSILKKKDIRPIVTLEAHRESWVLESLQTLKRLWPW